MTGSRRVSVLQRQALAGAAQGQVLGGLVGLALVAPFLLAPR